MSKKYKQFEIPVKSLNELQLGLNEVDSNEVLISMFNETWGGTVDYTKIVTSWSKGTEE